MALFPQVPEIFNQGAQIAIKTFNLKMPQGMLNVSGQIDFPKQQDGGANIFAMMTQIKGNFALEFPVQLVEQILSKRFTREIMRSGGTMMPVPPAMAQQQALEQQRTNRNAQGNANVPANSTMPGTNTGMVANTGTNSNDPVQAVKQRVDNQLVQEQLQKWEQAVWHVSSFRRAIA